jgi:hypothetical protein
MINGLAKSTTRAGDAVEYFLGAEFYDKESQEWKPRDPLPTLLEGDPEAIQVLCDSLQFKSQYTSGVLSFSPEETALISATPGMKDAILDDFKAFAFAGVPDDCRQFLAVEHTHRTPGGALPNPACSPRKRKVPKPIPTELRWGKG